MDRIQPTTKTLLLLFVTLWLSIWVFFVWIRIQHGELNFSHGEFSAHTTEFKFFLHKALIDDLLKRPYYSAVKTIKGIVNAPLWLNAAIAWATMAAFELTFLGITTSRKRFTVLGTGLWVITAWLTYAIGEAVY